MGYLGNKISKAINDSLDKGILRQEQCAKICEYFRENEEKILQSFKRFPNSTFEIAADICNVPYFEQNELDKVLSYLPTERGYVVIDGVSLKFYCRTDRGHIVIRGCERVGPEPESESDDAQTNTYAYDKPVHREPTALEKNQEKLDEYLTDITGRFKVMSSTIMSRSASVNEISDWLDYLTRYRNSASVMFPEKRLATKMSSTMFEFYGSTLELAKLAGYSEFEDKYSKHSEEVAQTEAEKKEKAEKKKQEKEEKKRKDEQERAEREAEWEARYELGRKIDKAQHPVRKKKWIFIAADTAVSIGVMSLSFLAGLAVWIVAYIFIRKWANKQLSIIENAIRAENEAK